MPSSAPAATSTSFGCTIVSSLTRWFSIVCVGRYSKQCGRLLWGHTDALSDGMASRDTVCSSAAQ